MWLIRTWKMQKKSRHKISLIYKLHYSLNSTIFIGLNIVHKDIREYLISLLCLVNDSFIKSIFVMVKGRAQGHTKVSRLSSKIRHDSPHVGPYPWLEALIHGHDVGTKAWFRFPTLGLESIIKQGGKCNVFCLVHSTWEAVVSWNPPISGDAVVYQTDILYKQI